MTLRVLDLFSGIGGFSLGLSWAGDFRTQAFVEINPWARRILQMHWPDARIYNDVEALNAQGGCGEKNRQTAKLFQGAA